MTRLNVTISTDGACSGNPGPGGYYGVIRFGEKSKTVSGWETRTSNNRMELQAVIESTKALKRPCDITLRTDSEYVINGINELAIRKKNKWEKKTGARYENVDMWQELSDTIEKGGHTFCCIYVPGHSGDADNEMCDKGAKEQVRIAKGV